MVTPNTPPQAQEEGLKGRTLSLDLRTQNRSGDKALVSTSAYWAEAGTCKI